MQKFTFDSYLPSTKKRQCSNIAEMDYSMTRADAIIIQHHEIEAKTKTPSNNLKITIILLLTKEKYVG